MKEKDFQTMFKHLNKEFGVFELKLCKGTSLSFDSVKSHQAINLSNVSNATGVYYKIPDSQFSGGMKANMNPKPFDCFNLNNTPAFVVVGFYKVRQPWKVFYFPILTFLAMRAESNKKSFTPDEAHKFCTHHYTWKKESKRGQKNVYTNISE